MRGSEDLPDVIPQPDAPRAGAGGLLTTYCLLLIVMTVIISTCTIAFITIIIIIAIATTIYWLRLAADPSRHQSVWK